MAILTKFLQLLKPERNDYVDVEKHLSENYDKIDTKMEELSNSNDKKLDKGAVSSEYDTAKKIEDKIKEAKKAGDTAKTEADKKLDKGNLISTIQSGEDIFKALQNNTGIKFDENLLYLNDEGTKKVGFCYLDRLTDGIFECIQETTEKVNNITYFENFSNKELLNKFQNFNNFLILTGSYASDPKSILYGENPQVLQHGNYFVVDKGVVTLPAGEYIIRASFFGTRPSTSSGTISFSIFDENETRVYSWGTYTFNNFGCGGTTLPYLLKIKSTKKIYIKVATNGATLTDNQSVEILKIE